MPLPIEDYALIGDCHTAALVGRDGSIDWLCFPRFDSGACFSALLGGPEHGRWLIAPDADVAAITSVERRYQQGTLILETDFVTRHGSVRITDCMPVSSVRRDVLRIVEGLSGCVAMCMELIVRLDYGSIVPWVRRIDNVLLATAGPDTLELRTQVEVNGENMKSVGRFEVRPGDRIPFLLTYRRSYEEPRADPDPEEMLASAVARETAWSGRCTYGGRWDEAVLRSLIVLKALTFAPTGGIVAAPTTSLPELAGGVRNWDYRYCWLRDATFALNALLVSGFHTEALAWREWLLRAVAGNPEDLQVLYSVTGKRRLEEMQLDWLPGYQGATPVRIGNAASKQFQLDIYGEVMDTLHLARAVGLPNDDATWRIQIALLAFVEANWQRPDEGIWEIRGQAQHFTHSKIMAWVAFDRAIRDVEKFGFEGPVDSWRHSRDAIHAQVCSQGFDADRNTFVQSYGSHCLDASLLLIPQVGFLPGDDPRVRGTVRAIEHDLMVDGLVLRYATQDNVDALPPGEGVFLPCSFWLADALVLCDRRDEGEALFERLLTLRNDVGLLAEQYDTRGRHMLGNFPQALTHMALINSARLLSMNDEQAKRAQKTGQRPASASSM